MKKLLFFFGLMCSIIFGGGFANRLIRDGEFYIAEFIGGVLGCIFMLISLFIEKRENFTLKLLKRSDRLLRK
jgi:hypothetical protein